LFRVRFPRSKFHGAESWFQSWVQRQKVAQTTTNRTTQAIVAFTTVVLLPHQVWLHQGPGF